MDALVDALLTPLTIIKGNATLLQMVADAGQTVVQVETLTDIIAAVDDLTALITPLLRPEGAPP
jgi:K+-sensing histidine kinase KdpD